MIVNRDVCVNDRSKDLLILVTKKAKCYLFDDNNTNRMKKKNKNEIEIEID